MSEKLKTHVGEQPGKLAAEILFWNKPELARTVRRSTRTVEIWMREGRIPYLRIGPRTVLFEKQAVLEALKKFRACTIIRGRFWANSGFCKLFS